MKTITLSDMSQSDFDSAAQTVAAGIKAYNRKLDTRAGTVLRDLLVDPSAAMFGVMSRQISEVRKSSSLKLMQTAQEEGEEIDQSDIDAVMANFNIKPHAATYAHGIVRMVVSDGTISYVVQEGARFSTGEGLEFTADSQVVAVSAEVTNPGVEPTTKLYRGAAGYFFLVPVTASANGSESNISQGTSLVPTSTISSFVMAEAYKDFCGGTDVQSLDSVVKSIPSGLSIRGFVNKSAVEGMLRDEFDGGENPIVAVSAVGYGNPAQIRDKHNLFGVGVGGRVDVYVRNFSSIYTSTAVVKGTLKTVEGVRTYVLEVPSGTFPGACWIKSVADPSDAGDDGEEGVLSSLAFTAERTADISGTWHDFDESTKAVEAFNTIWQGFRITVVDVPPDIGTDTSSSEDDSWSAERDFEVTAYCIPQAEDLQGFVDRDDVRNVSTDVVVRCPIVCRVSVNAHVKYDPKMPMDESTAKTSIRKFINGLGFVGRLTRSDIVQILKNEGAVSVEMPNKDMLYGELHDAAGARHVLSGDALDISSIEDGAVMLSKDTVVFVADENDIQISMTPNT